MQAKALVLQQGQGQIALVFCDLVGVPLKVSRQARAEASRATGIPVTNIVIAATHSHTGPLFDDVRRDEFHEAALARFHKDPAEKIDYPAFLVKQIVQVIVAAKAKAQPAELDAGIATQTGLAFNRRFHMKNGKVVFNPGLLNPNVIGPAGPVDPDVGILMVKNKKNPDPIGGLTVFAMHADTVGGTEFSADYPYYLQQTLRKVYGSNYISAFGAGTCGDINHVDVSRKYRVTGLDVTEGLGETLGATVLADVPELKAIDHPALAVRSRTLDLPLQTVTPREVAEAEVIVSRVRDTNLNFYAKVGAVKTIGPASSAARTGRWKCK